MFKFRLSKILRLRTHQEKLCLEQVAISLNKLQSVQQKKVKLNQIIIEKEKEYLYSMEKIVSIERILFYKNYLDLQAQKLLQLEMEIEKCKKELATAQTKLRMAMKERKILTKLREKQAGRFRQLENKKEQILLDELAISFSKGQRD
mgnify:CR=1 FL=1